MVLSRGCPYDITSYGKLLKRFQKSKDKVNISEMKIRPRISHFLPMRSVLILSLVGACFCETTLTSTDGITTESKAPTTQTTAFIHSTRRAAKLLGSTSVQTTSTTKESTETTKAYVTSESPPTLRHSTTIQTSTKGVARSAWQQTLNAGNASSVQSAHLPRLQERLGAVDCDLPVLPSKSRLWRGNETHELNLPVVMSAMCTGASTTPAADEDCRPMIVSWEGVADIQSGDILIVRIVDSLLVKTQAKLDGKNATNASVSPDGESSHHMTVQPAVYQVTRQGHEHCDVTEGMLLDVTPLDEGGSKIFTLYDKDLMEGVNLFIVVSKKWGSQCVRLKVTIKSDNCGESQDCSGNGVCYTNVSMEGYECQCCPGFAAPHCEDKDACNPSPCLNNGICVDLTQTSSGAAAGNYHCLCPFGFTGRKCEQDPCASAPCQNGGSCKSMAMNGTTTFHCACPEGWMGAHCETSAAGGACAFANPCVNGICVEQKDEIDGEKCRCFCLPGYTGEHCEVEYNECESSPCANGGTCTDRVAGFECSCGRGYTGNTCQLKVDLCSPNPCPKPRLCIDRGNSYSCECPSGFVGDECQMPARSPCDKNPCGHGGTCWSDVGSSYVFCSCRPGYTGKLCEEDFILESVVSSEMERAEARGTGSVREVHLPLGLYHDRLHNVYIAAGTLGAAIAIVGVVVTACHCRVNKTYSRILSRLSKVTESSPPHHWLEDKRTPPHPSAFAPASTGLDTTDMYYTLDFSDSQSSPLIQ